ncbi:metallophosphoesterase family protein [Terrarubrum flagellatum]|uniref:metallophosphoesterase family protein n=1 Tax=Terrirubrum flagellatum TaxID=2895980 RepID=UPI00314557CB
MRVAILADIHGNALALEAVLARLREDAPDFTVNLGDCVSGPLWPRETAGILMAQDWPTVRGNHDRWVTDQSRAEMIPSDGFARDEMSDAQLDWLRALPSILQLDDMLMFHARPKDDNAYLLDDVAPSGEMTLAPRERIEAHLAGESAPLILCGHSHLPRVVMTANGGVIVNPGSVGAPGYHDPTPPIEHWAEVGSPHARYAIATRRGGVWSAALHAVEYDWDAAAKRAASLDRPDWARALATGFVRDRGGRIGDD